MQEKLLKTFLGNQGSLIMQSDSVKPPKNVAVVL